MNNFQKWITYKGVQHLMPQVKGQVIWSLHSIVQLTRKQGELSTPTALHCLLTTASNLSPSTQLSQSTTFANHRESLW